MVQSHMQDWCTVITLSASVKNNQHYRYHLSFSPQSLKGRQNQGDFTRGGWFRWSEFGSWDQRLCCGGQFAVPRWQTTSWPGLSPEVQTAVHVFLPAALTPYMCFQIGEHPGWDIQAAFRCIVAPECNNRSLIIIRGNVPVLVRFWSCGDWPVK